ncbi:adenine deaminase [Methanospirillum lacunae]|nr:adenine deaminase [Methanospirillum lacunae]
MNRTLPIVNTITNTDKMKLFIDVARGVRPADLVITNAQIYNPFIREWEIGSLAIQDGRIAGVGNYHGMHELNLKGLSIVPGLIDAHVHIESSLLTPAEYARVVLLHGTTTVIADPHEIANVCGKDGIKYMLKSQDVTPLDLFFTLPSCVPATPLDESAEILSAEDLTMFIHHSGVVGLGEMMNVPGTLNQDPDVMKKLALSDIKEGHAPFLRGPDLQAYIATGVQSDHETISLEEAREKIKSGMYLYVREGSTEKNLNVLLPAITSATADRCSFCTDDRHVDMLVESGHIDDCIRKAIESGLEPELAYRLATLSPAERFGLHDRGALNPGRLADFCVIDDVNTCNVIRTFKHGKEILNISYHATPTCSYQFRSHVPSPEDIRITGNGRARVVGIIPEQIATDSLIYEISGETPYDIDQDIIKVVVASRYYEDRVGIGLVHGLKMKEGAIASSVAHDSHHVIAAGTSDDEILHACREVIRNRGGMVCVHDGFSTVLPLSCAGLMADEPYTQVYNQLSKLNKLTEKTGAIENPFMYLSFLSLTVIPSLRITPGGVFDCSLFAQVPLFIDEMGS